MMYCLVRFLEDGLYFVCNEKHLIFKNGALLAKYKNNNYYRANIISRYHDLKVLVDLKHSIISNLPIVLLSKHHINLNNNKSQWVKVQSNNLVIPNINNDNPQILQSTIFTDYSIVDNCVIEDAEFIMLDSNEAGADFLVVNSPKKSCPNMYSDNLSVIKNLPQFAAPDDIECDNTSEYFMINSNEMGAEILMTSPKKNSLIENVSVIKNPPQLVSGNTQCDTISKCTTMTKHPKINSHNKYSAQISAVQNESPPHFAAVDTEYDNFKSLKVLTSKCATKTDFCVYCKQLKTKLSKHVISNHGEEEKVKKLIHLPKRSKLRLEVLKEIRNAGNFIHNTNMEYNTGVLLVTRRPASNKSRSQQHYMPCSNCKGMYSHLSLRAHYRRCKVDRQKGSKDAISSSQQMHIFIHKIACSKLSKRVFPILRRDDVVEAIRFDRLAIMYGNKLCDTYRLPHHDDLIRSKLRNLGRFILSFNKNSPEFKCLEDMLIPQNFDALLNTIHRVSGLDEDTGVYSKPSKALSLGTELKKITKILERDSIKTQDNIKIKMCRDLLCLLEGELDTAVNKTVMENLLDNKRHKKEVIVAKQDIIKLDRYLQHQLKSCYEALCNEVNFGNWHLLASCILCSIQIFNRKRGGELERITIADFRNYQSIETCDVDSFNMLSQDEKSQGRRYVRFTLRGKLAREVAVVLDKQLAKTLEFLIQTRELVGVQADNPFVFGLPSQDRNRFTYLRSGPLLKQFSKDCGANKPELLKGTALRKQLATEGERQGLNPMQTSMLTDFMGHRVDIHNRYYRLSTGLRQICNVTKTLEKAAGRLNENATTHISDELLETPDPIPSTSTTPPHNYSVDINNTYILEESNNKDPTWRPDSRQSIASSSDSHSIDHNIVIKRRSWDTPERQSARKCFSQYINRNILPTLEQCKKILFQEPSLHLRTPEQVVAWVQNQIKKKDHTPKISNSKKTWTTPEKHAVRQLFENNLIDLKVPSSMQCKTAAMAAELKGRTPEIIKAFVCNEIRRRKLKS